MSFPRHRLPVLGALLLLPVLIALVGYSMVMANRVSATTAILDALAKTRASGTYHLTADVQQTLLSASALPSSLPTDGKSMLRVEGDVVQPTQAASDMPDVRLRLLTDPRAPGVDLLLVDGKAYIGHNDKWQTVKNPLAGTTTDGDYLDYLAAVVNVVKIEPVKTAAGMLDRYTFDLDGPRYAEYQRARMEKLLASELPAHIKLGPSPRYEQM